MCWLGGGFIWNLNGPKQSYANLGSDSFWCIREPKPRVVVGWCAFQASTLLLSFIKLARATIVEVEHCWYGHGIDHRALICYYKKHQSGVPTKSLLMLISSSKVSVSLSRKRITTNSKTNVYVYIYTTQRIKKQWLYSLYSDLFILTKFDQDVTQEGLL